jgi:concanavalin A-like lectin/glucanase superfamily protein
MQLIKTLISAVAILLATLAASANEQYTPDTLEFPSSAPLVFASNPVLNLPEGGAIEFWVVTDWTGNPGYHPVMLANGNATTPIYQVSITADQDAMIFQSGREFGLFPFDFSDGRTHHVILLDYEEQIVAFIDGKLVGAVAMSIKPGVGNEFFVGSAAGGKAPFMGAVAAVRIWDVPPAPEDAAEFALRDINDTNDPHPNLDNLVGLSDFRNRTFSVVDSLVLNESELMTRAEVIDTLGEAEVQALDLEFASATGENDE